MRVIWLSVAAGLCMAAAPVRAQNAPALPQGQGRDIVAVACTQCHTLAPLFAMRDGPAGWKRHVYNMVLRGAQLTPREADTVIAYLTTHFGPAAPAAASVALPAANGVMIVMARVG